MEQLLKSRIKTKKDTQANWESANPVLKDGEEILVVCSDGKTRRKIGDGTSSYSSLPYADYGLVPIERTVNGKALSSDISLTASDVGASSSSHTHDNYIKVGEAITLTAVIAVLAISIIAVVVYKLFTSKEGKTSMPGGWSFQRK